MRVQIRLSDSSYVIIEGVTEFDFDPANHKLVYSTVANPSLRDILGIKTIKVTTDVGDCLYEWKKPKTTVSNTLVRHENVENFRTSQDGGVAQALKSSVTMAMQQQDPTKRVSTSDVNLALTGDGAECLFALLYVKMNYPGDEDNPLRDTIRFLKRAYGDKADELTDKWGKYI